MIPIGGIILWSGSIITIPANWQLCDGSDGTPDLRDRFIMGAGVGSGVDDTGGTVEHLHEVDFGNHNHAPGNTTVVTSPGPVNAWAASSSSAETEISGTTGMAGTLPLFHALAFIQRMS